MKYEKGGFFEINVDASLFFIEPCELNAPLRFRHRFNLKKKRKKIVRNHFIIFHVKEKKKKGGGNLFWAKEAEFTRQNFFFFFPYVTRSSHDL